MSDLRGISLAEHLDAIFYDYQKKRKVYGYSAAKFFYGISGFDFSAELYDKRVATPLGPAAGPHTQLAQNIVLAFLHGSRIIELKTVQKLDRLKISRPCIDIRNIGFNIEWSQELSLKESYEEYVKAWVLLHIIRHSELLGPHKNSIFYNVVFDMSVGYDLAGISSQPVRNWINSMYDASDKINELLTSLPRRYAHFKKIPIPAQISDSVTLSTFHGCPAAEIEDIVRFLIKRHKLNVVVKMNPTLAGFPFVQETLQRKLGYKHIVADEEAFAKDLPFNEAVKLMRRLTLFAREQGRILGAKFSNTLVVKNNESVFSEKKRYLSGAPLYVLAMYLVRRFREEMGSEFPLSFSGGINRDNFSEAVSCGLLPVTTCTDILKKGGYARLHAYLQNLATDMQAVKAPHIASFILRSAGYLEDQELHLAAQINSERVAAEALKNPAYRLINNARPPKKINSTLTLFDCLSCNICLPVCPNAATFSYETPLIDLPLINYTFTAGQLHPMQTGRFIIEKKTQIGILDSFCNDCGNCGTFCPEQGGPYLQKARFFQTMENFKNASNREGFFFHSRNHLSGRIDGRVSHLILTEGSGELHWKQGENTITFNREGTLIRFKAGTTLKENQIINNRSFLILRLLLLAFRNQRDHYPAGLLIKNSAD